MVSSTSTIIDTVKTLEPFDMTYVSFSVGFAQTAEVSITFESTGGVITLYLTDEENFNRMRDLKMFEGWFIEDRASGSLVRELSSGNWYITFWNTDIVTSTVTITATLEILSDSSLGFVVLGLVFIGVVCGVSIFLLKRRSKPQPTIPPMTPTPPSERYCPDCGESVPPHLNYCGQCGTRLKLTLTKNEITETP